MCPVAVELDAIKHRSISHLEDFFYGKPRLMCECQYGPSVLDSFGHDDVAQYFDELHRLISEILDLELA
jgi:hypothetical protein